MPREAAWSLVAKAAAWLTGLVGAFLIVPPRLTYDSNSALTLHFAQFVLAVLLGLFFVATPRPTGPRRRRWRIASLGCLVAGVTLYFTYIGLAPLWSAAYDVFKVIIGQNYTAMAQSYVDKHPGTSPSELLLLAGGASDKIWPMDELVVRYVVLCAAYTGAMLSLSAAVMAMIEYLRTSPRHGRAP